MLFTAWVNAVQELCALVNALASLGESLGVPDLRKTDWHGQLFDKLAPQVSPEAVLVVAVCGGTNTGKSLITNALVGSPISRSVPEAARTRYPVASLPKGLVARIDPAKLFPGFVTAKWQSPEDAIDGGVQKSDQNDSVHRLVWREDVSGQQSPRLVLLDTPDIDGTLQANWHRAELVRNACDVIVAVLTQQKYNDATVREFFRAAATAQKTTIIVFNMVDWPVQRDRITGWLATFCAQTGIAPAAVYAVPFDAAAAAAGSITFYALPELSVAGQLSNRNGLDRSLDKQIDESQDLASRLANVDFNRIKLRAMKGAFQVVLNPHTGVGAWLDAFETSASQWQEVKRLLAVEARVRVELPTAPRELVWQEIWQWLEPRRSGFDLTVSKAYRFAGKGLRIVAGKTGLIRSDAKRREDFSALELAALKRGLADFVERLEDISRSPQQSPRRQLARWRARRRQSHGVVSRFRMPTRGLADCFGRLPSVCPLRARSLFQPKPRCPPLDSHWSQCWCRGTACDYRGARVGWRGGSACCCGHGRRAFLACPPRGRCCGGRRCHASGRGCAGADNRRTEAAYRNAFRRLVF
ncbi:MAG: 50S ribosome-binding GTPase [Planctomycetia bacterium]|nr:50S ribosome-binding GTPase [Planctomycetia bacterium]